ncbi:MAG: nucleotidyltransferase domain-containing protein [Myxococcota bacterium]
MLRDPSVLAATLHSSDRCALDELVRAARALLGAQLGRIAVYGSHARGDSGEDSDLDVLVIVADSVVAQAKHALRRTAAELNVAHDTALAILVLGEGQWRELEERGRLIAVDIAREAIDL